MLFGPNSRVDLHLHSVLSDGKYPADDVLRRAASCGTAIMALTDHDFASPLQTGWQQIDEHNLFVLGGAEISAVHNGHELHFLTYFRGAIPAAYREFCDERCLERTQRYNEAVRELKVRFDIELSEIAPTTFRAVTRYHLAQELIKAGYAKNKRSAFSRFLSHRLQTVPMVTLTVQQAIAAAHSNNAVIVWAHPSVGHAQQYLSEFVGLGLDGIEVYRPMLKSKHKAKLRKMALSHNLLITGGSDWHGWPGDGEFGLFSCKYADLQPFIEHMGVV